MRARERRYEAPREAVRDRQNRQTAGQEATGAKQVCQNGRTDCQKRQEAAGETLWHAFGPTKGDAAAQASAKNRDEKQIINNQ